MFIAAIKYPRDGNVPPTYFFGSPAAAWHNRATFAFTQFLSSKKYKYQTQILLA
jgi:hypothetical protein